MREIKFRAWDKANKEMYQARTLTWDRWNNVAEGQDPIMQYTGLKDKNGKEIYEGDIVKIRLAVGFMTTAKVEFIDGCFDVYAIHGHIYTQSYPNGKILNRKKDYLKCYTVNHAVEIIGNIYENPELLGDEEPQSSK